jgi:hypothetical protein
MSAWRFDDASRVRRAPSGAAMKGNRLPLFLLAVGVGAALTWGIALPAASQELFIYPAKGQSPAQENQDKGECMVWATNQTGYDPATASGPGGPPQMGSPMAGAFGGAARGAAVGAIGGAIGGNAGRGAEIGAAAGGIFGMMRQRQRYQEEMSYYGAAQDQAAAQRANFQKAYSACLQGRGYVVE